MPGSVRIDLPGVVTAVHLGFANGGEGFAAVFGFQDGHAEDVNPFRVACGHADDAEVVAVGKINAVQRFFVRALPGFAAIFGAVHLSPDYRGIEELRIGIFQIGDQRHRLEDGGRLADCFAETSLLPLAAVMSRRSSLRPSELPWLTIALGIAMGIGVYRLHPMLFW